MDLLVERTILTLYYLILGVLALYGSHRLLMVVLYYRTRHRTPPRPADPDTWPVVTVQLPLYNEMYVAQRLIEAVCRFDYPRERLEIQVLDDSTDETRDLVAETVEHFRSQGFDIHHLHRTDRTGYKAGALEAGLAQARGDLVAVFDADFVPQPDFLRRMVPYFADAGIGMVQARWGHVNRDYSLLTRVQAMFLDGHFAIEHFARNRSGRFFNFNGTAGIWRRQAIEDAGGWEHDTLTEDLDLSYRSQLAGWRFLFINDVVAPAELPVDVLGFKRQQFRWAKGSIQTARKLLKRILSAPVPLKVKLEAFVHLTNNICYPLMIGLSLLIFPAMVLRRGSSPLVLMLVDTPLFLAATVSVFLFYLTSQRAVGADWRDQLKRLPPLMGLGIGLAINNSRAVIEGWLSDGGEFERTPKYRIEGLADGWREKRYRPRRNISFLLEGAFAVYFLGVTLAAWDTGMWLSIPFLYLFLQGFAYMFLLSLASLWPGNGAEAAQLAPLRSAD